VSGNTAQDLIRKCQSALNDPQTDIARFRQLIAECSISLTELADHRRLLLNAMSAEIGEISALVASQTAVWPEDVARLQALSQEIQKRSALFKDS